MTPSRHMRKSRRLSHKSPMELADYDWLGAASLQLLHSGSDVEATPSATHLAPPSPSSCTTISSESPPAILTHLPFTPGSSHTRNRKENHVPRPPNAFMLFRSWLWQRNDLKSVERDNRNVSRIAGRYWNELSEAERAPFRTLAEQVKETHAKIFPDYRYSPGSQKKAKVSQRRPQRHTNVEVEVEKCKKVADLLLEGVTSHDLAKYLVDDRKKVKSEEGATFVHATEESSASAASRNAHKRPAASHGESPPAQSRSKKPKTVVPPHLTSTYPQYAAPLPIPLIADEMTPAPSTHTPELTYPPVEAERFVPTDDIPHLSLDNWDELVSHGELPALPMLTSPQPLLNEHDLSALFPPHLLPSAGTVFGVKPDAASYVNSCMPYNADVLDLPSVFPFSDYEPEPYSSMVPQASSAFTDPFDFSTLMDNHSGILGTLDQLFGPISPLTPVFPY